MASKETIDEKVFVLMHLMHPVRHAGNGRHPVDVSRGQGRVFALLKIKDGISTRQLAQVLGVRISSLNETLVRLESAGLVERRPSDNDKRVMLVYLTDAGKRREIEDSVQPDPYEDFSEEDFAVLEGLLDRMIANVEKTVGKGLSEHIAEEAGKRRKMLESMRGVDGHGDGRGGRGGRRCGGGHGGCDGHDRHGIHDGHGMHDGRCGNGNERGVRRRGGCSSAAGTEGRA